MWKVSIVGKSIKNNISVNDIKLALIWSKFSNDCAFSLYKKYIWSKKYKQFLTTLTKIIHIAVLLMTVYIYINTKTKENSFLRRYFQFQRRKRVSGDWDPDLHTSLIEFNCCISRGIQDWARLWGWGCETGEEMQLERDGFEDFSLGISQYEWCLWSYNNLISGVHIFVWKYYSAFLIKHYL